MPNYAPDSITASLAAASAKLSHSDSPRLDAELLLAEVLGCERSRFYAFPEQLLSAEEQAAFSALVARRERGEPVAHILGYREFWSLRLAVNAETLIPRPDTETLVEQALNLDVPNDARVLDLGTGTGAIALALASERAGWDITGLDLREAAVVLAQDNCQQHFGATQSRLRFLASDWFTAVAGQRFHIVLSNPPYIDAQDPHLAEGDVRFEPHSALVAEEAGLADLRHIIDAAPDYLLPGGRLLLEHGWQQAEAVQDMLRRRGFSDVGSHKDLAGQWRVSQGSWA